MLLIKTSFVLKYVNRGQLLISWMFFRCHWSWLWVKRQLYRSHTFNEMIPFSQKIKYLNKTNKYFHSTNSASFLVCVISIIHFPSLRVCVIHPTIATISIHQFPFGLSLCGIFLFDSFFVIFLSFLFLLSCHSSGNHHRTFLYQSNTLPLISLSALMLCPLAVIIAACAITMRLHAYYAAIQQMYINLYVNAYATVYHYLCVPTCSSNIAPWIETSRVHVFRNVIPGKNWWSPQNHHSMGIHVSRIVPRQITPKTNRTTVNIGPGRPLSLHMASNKRKLWPPKQCTYNDIIRLNFCETGMLWVQ